MKLLQLEYFCIINKYGSFRQAAKILGISQPAITFAIRKLEEEFDTPLLVRNSQTVVLTDAGQMALRRAVNILDEISCLRMELNAVLPTEEQKIRLAFCLCEDLPVRVASKFAVAHPDISVVMEHCNAPGIIQGLENEEYDIGITFNELVTHKQDSLPYGKQEFGVFCRNGHPFKDFDEIAPSQLEKQTLLLPGVKKEIERMLLFYCSENHIPLQIKKIKSGMDFFVASVMAGHDDGIAILPICWKNDVDTLCARKLNPPLYMDLSVVWPKNKFLNKAFRTMIDFLCSNQK